MTSAMVVIASWLSQREASFARSVVQIWLAWICCADLHGLMRGRLGADASLLPISA